jgi:hypothetical protein
LLAFGQFSGGRKVALLDLTVRNSEANYSRIRSCRYVLQVAGVPYIETASLSEALQYPVLLISPIVYSTTFSSAERTLIQNYVNSGGVVISSSLRDPGLYGVFGITSNSFSSTSKRIIWDKNAVPSYFDRFDETNEIRGSLGDTTVTSGIFNVRTYVPSSGTTVLARYENNAVAATRKQYGQGYAIALGVDLRDVIARNQINSDYEASRTYSNGFEPTTDMFVFFIQNIIRTHLPHTVRMHTCPDCDNGVVMITHDCDSKTSLDTMVSFIDYEQANQLNAMYNVTVRYNHDEWMSNFYTGNEYRVEYAVQHGQRIASHSVGHFPDFMDSTLFATGTFGNTMSNYHPMYTGGHTTGGTAFGEAEVSKNELETRFGQPVKSFRSGHLCFHPRQAYVLQQLGYLYNSTFSANDVLTNFPFWDIDHNKFSGNQTNVLEIPMTISDASASNPFTLQNYSTIAQNWVDVTRKNLNNSAPTVLLIHPNRSYKLTAEQMYVNGMPSGTRFMFLDDFGDWWRTRLQTTCNSTLSNDTLKVNLNAWMVSGNQSVVIDQVAGLSAVVFYNNQGYRMIADAVPGSFGETRYCHFQIDPSLEVCNGIDDDLDGLTDEGLVFVTYYLDNDQDGYGQTNVNVSACQAVPGYVALNGDCNDASQSIGPSAQEICNNIDDNCSGSIDEGWLKLPSTAVQATTYAYPNTSSSSYFTINLNNGVDHPLVEGTGKDLWYKFTAQYNTLKATITNATGEISLSLYSYSTTGCVELIQTECEAGFANQVLMNDQMIIGQNYLLLVHQVNGTMSTGAKLSIQHLLGSAPDHVYGVNGTSSYSSVCNSFKAVYRSGGAAYVFQVLSSTSNPQMTPWSYTTPTYNAVLAKLGTLLPANTGSSTVTYTVKIPVQYVFADAAGNNSIMMADPGVTGVVSLLPEVGPQLRSADRCPTTKTLSSQVITDKSICGAVKYEWEFTQTAPTAGMPVTVLGPLNTNAIILNTVPGIATGRTYNVRIRPVHANGGASSWGAVQCLKTTGTASMIVEQPEENTVSASLENWTVSIYPNPSNGAPIHAIIEGAEGPIHLQVFDLTGKRVMQQQWNVEGMTNTTLLLDQDLANGMYTLQFSSGTTQQCLKLMIVD